MMEPTLFVKALVMGIVEGLTEFLPVSSTGHLILAGHLLAFNSKQGTAFEIVIQSGAMLAVLWEYRARFGDMGRTLLWDRRSQRLMTNLALAFLPAAVLGVLVGHLVTTYLFTPLPVALAFIAGGFVILWAERREHRIRVIDIDAMGWPDALTIGCAQCLALIPGMSRSGTTIIGGLLAGLSRTAATEFSFFLAMPTLVGAAAFQLWKERTDLSMADASTFGVGSVAAFLSAFLCIRWLLRYLRGHDFSGFAWYRVAFGIVVLVTAHTGVVNWTQR